MFHHFYLTDAPLITIVALQHLFCYLSSSLLWFSLLYVFVIISIHMLFYCAIFGSLRCLVVSSPIIILLPTRQWYLHQVVGIATVILLALDSCNGVNRVILLTKRIIWLSLLTKGNNNKKDNETRCLSALTKHDLAPQDDQ